jgi:hypothetical protein
MGADAESLLELAPEGEVRGNYGLSWHVSSHWNWIERNYDSFRAFREHGATVSVLGGNVYVDELKRPVVLSNGLSDIMNEKITWNVVGLVVLYDEDIGKLDTVLSKLLTAGKETTLLTPTMILSAWRARPSGWKSRLFFWTDQ